MEDLINRQVAIDKLSEIYYRTPNLKKGVENAIKVISEIPASDDESITMMNSLYCLRETRNKLWEEVKDFLFKTLSEENPILSEADQRTYDEIASKVTLLSEAICVIEEMEYMKHEKERQKGKR